MDIALIGATGFVGSAILNELLGRGHTVTAVCRHTDMLPKDARVVPFRADVQDQASLLPALRQKDAVISAFNTSWSDPAQAKDFVPGSLKIEKATGEAGARRLIVVGGAGSLYDDNGRQLVDSKDFPEQWKAGASAARDYLEVLKKNQTLDWTFVSPAIEMTPATSGGRKGEYRTGRDKPLFDAEGHSRISVQDLAVAVVDELERPAHIRERFTVAY